MLLIIWNGELVKCMAVKYGLQTKVRIIDIFDGSGYKTLPELYFSVFSPRFTLKVVSRCLQSPVK